ncbi:MAG TPA: hypothetical protein VHE35_01190 [Kofleriaceae bacterium]|nr:hypothetical protein [Kofleriaceae bacterium]
MHHRLRRSLSLVTAAALLAGFAGAALAQSGPVKGKPAKETKAPHVKTITIEEEVIEDGVPGGEIIPVDARGFADHGSLIRLRHSFVDKILESADRI